MNYIWSVVDVARLKTALARTTRTEHVRGLHYTDGAGKPHCLMGRTIASLRKVLTLDWPEHLEMASFSNEAVQDYLIVQYDLQFTPEAIAYGAEVQALTDGMFKWTEIT